MEEFLARLKADFTNFDRHELVLALIKQIAEIHIPGDKAMLPTCFSLGPAELEQGTFLALDLGGSTFRVGFVSLTGQTNSPKLLRSASWKVPEAVKVTSAHALFEWMAQRVRDFLGEVDSKRQWTTGLTFSFPIKQTSVNTGRIMTMGKGYKFTDDVSERCIKSLFEEAFERENLNVLLKAIVNDSVSTLLSLCFSDERRAMMSLVLGTGCNSALYCSASIFASPIDEVRIINTEMSMFGSGVLPATKYDAVIDHASTVPGYQPLEQMTSGRYLGEVVRLIIMDAVDSLGFLDGKMPPTLRLSMAFESDIISALGCDSSAGIGQLGSMLDAMHPKETGLYTTDEVICIQKIAYQVSQRAATLLAVVLAALSSFVPRETVCMSKDIICACDGSLLHMHEALIEHCEFVLDEMHSSVRLVPVSDGSLLGAAVAAAQHGRLK